MRQLMLGICFFLALGGIAQAEEGKPAETNPPTPSKDVQQFQLVIQGQNRFAFDLFQQMTKRRGNLVFSPYNVATGLALAAVGSKSETANEIQRALHYSLALSPLIKSINQFFNSNESKNGTQLFFANSVWLQEGVPLIPAYALTLKRDFNLNLNSVNFHSALIQSVRTINQWVSNQTKGKISQLLIPQEVSEMTRFVLTTALYMKGGWNYPFDLRQTVRTPFYIREKSNMQIEMMYAKTKYRAWINENFTLVEIPYAFSEKGMQLAMIILLPKQVEGWQRLESEVNFDNWQKWQTSLTLQPIHLGLPRFRVEDKVDLNPVMQTLGIKQIFTSEADFSGITGEKDFFLNKAVHKTLIRVDEKGTDALNSTKIAQTIKTDEEKSLEILVDHPFFFFIVEQRTQSILFMGRIVQP